MTHNNTCLVLLLFLIFFVTPTAGSVSTALPILSKTAPYADIPTQGSPNWGGIDREFLQAGHNERIRQNGTIYQIRFAVVNTSVLEQFNFTIWRQNGSNFDMVATTNNLIDNISNGINLITLSSPINGVQEGDFYGYRIKASQNSLYAYYNINHLAYYKDGGATSKKNYDWKGNFANNIFVIDIFMEKPYMVFIGDSIISGFPAHRSFITEATTITDIPSTIENHWGIKVNKSYQNMGYAAQTTSQINNRFNSDVISLSPEFVLIEGGVNDVINKASTQEILVNWESMVQKAHNNNITPVIMLILPYTGGSDQQLNTIMYINEQLINISKKYSPSLVVDARCYVGLSRPSGPSGNCWDIKASYTSDGLHYNSAGHERIAQAIKDSFNSINSSTLPGITTQPSSQTVNAGQTATFSVVATGTAPLTYQWQKNSVNIAGAVSPIYKTPATILSDSGSTYRVIVTNSAGSTTSTAATLTVNPTTAINLIINPGFESGTASWLFYTNGVGTLSSSSPGYGGSSNAAKLAFISIGTSMQLYQTGVTLEPNTRYRLSFAAYSTKGHDMKVNLIKHVAPFTNYGLYQPINLGTGWQSFSIEFTTSGFASTVRDGRLQFWFAGTGFAAAGDIYYIDDVRLEKVISATVPPTIITQPSSQTVNAGQAATFSVIATGTAPLTYQWQKNSVNIAGAVSPTYKTPTTILSDSGSTYRVIVTNSAGSTTSTAATLTVNPATAINLIINPGFESGTVSWLFYTNGVGTLSSSPPGYGGSSNAAKLAFISIGTNMQLYQTGVTLEPNTRYRLSFAAYSTKGHDLKVNLIKHVAPFTNYGLYQPINLGTGWQSFTIEFTTSGFAGTVRDGRLQFWFAGTGFAAAGDIYYIDNIELKKV